MAPLIDGIEFAGQTLIVPLGVEENGTKHVLGLWQGGHGGRHATVVKALLEDLVARGIDPERRYVFVVDGSKALGGGGEGHFGSDPLREGWRSNVDFCAEESQWCYLRSPYRFMYLIQKAQEYASKAQELGAALLSAFEKGDAEYLASLRAGHERDLLTLALQAKQDQWRDADWQVEAVPRQKVVHLQNE